MEICGNQNPHPKRLCNRRNVPQPPPYILVVQIKKATNVEGLAGEFNTMFGVYQVRITETQFQREFRTPKVLGNPQPNWRHCVNIPFDELPGRDECLLLEVLKFGSEDDPGPSAGTVVVGRAKIPIPIEAGDCGDQRYALVRLSGLEKSIGGFIRLSVDLEEISFSD